MADVVDAATRSRMMAGIQGRNTRPEVLVRQHLHSRGLRYSLGGAGLPGRPDIVLAKWKVAVFVHGCFWHWHGCSLSKVPTSNKAFWQQKLAGNENRDTIAILSLLSEGWRVALVWECVLRGRTALSELGPRMDTLASWIKSPGRKSVLELPAPVSARNTNAH